MSFWFGGTLILNNEYSLFQFFVCFATLISGSQIAGSIFTFAPDASKAMHASWDTQELLAREPTVRNKENPSDQSGSKRRHGGPH